ncbi:MAG: antitoxin family protein [Methanofollis sp.]|uniref:antitoxin family protein n=1 Tax=Methanofollis sp. TaxID=2052835 RepID=UPI002622027A|nr:antitoxin family protein [Methanofollis sp.]MDD4254235.1 antitoxin family protein [Methanofollis sp.]
MTKVIDAVYESSVLKPLEKIDLKEGTRIRIAIEEPSAVIEDAFGLLKGKDTTEALKEMDDEWGLY